jgi:hypothetical protein
VTDAFSTSPGSGPRSWETRYYVCSRLASAAAFAEAIRGHGGIENCVPYIKDVTLREDASALSGLNYWVEALESDSSILGCELPIDAFLQRISLHFPGLGLVAQCFDVWNTPV